MLWVDGGSEDDSAALIARAGFAVLNAPAGRARQMNAGAARASGVHHWGRFDVCINGQHWMLRVIGHMMNLRSRLTGIATGDQALFMTRAAFDAVGGFPDQAPMEDIELSKRVLRHTLREALAAQVGPVELCVAPSADHPIWQPWRYP